nr:reverse transcriptase domain-containing protein [Tanacetum cinerariifolium]
MANTTPIVTTVTKPATNPRDADATPKVNIQDFCEEYYEDILPIIMDKVRRDKRKEVHARLDFVKGSKERRTREDSHYSSARSLTARPERLKVQDRLRYSDRHVLDRLGRTNSRDHPSGRSRPHRLDASNEGCPKDRERFRGVGESYDDSQSHSYHDRDRSRHMKKRRDSESPLSSVSKSDSSDGRYRKSKSKRHKPTDEDDLTRPWMCEEVERWAMPTWCHMFNSALIGAARVWFDELPPESIDSYKDLKAAFLAYFMQQKKYVKDNAEIHNIKQKDGETIEDFMKRFKVKTGRMKGAPKCMQIFGFMHGVNNPKLTKRLNEHVPKTMKEMMITTTAFIRGEAAAASKKKGKFQPPPPMVTPVEKRSNNKFCNFHNDKGHSTDVCMQLKKQIEELVRARKLSHLIKEIKHRRDHSKVAKKETPAKDKPAKIYMIQSWKRMTRKIVTQIFECVREITFPPLTTSSGAETPLVIEAEIGGHMIHRMYVEGGFSMEILYEHCFKWLRPEVKNQMVSATTSLTGFSEETIWPLGQLRLLVTIGDANQSTKAWMNFMIVRSLSPYNGIIGRPGIKEIQAVPKEIGVCYENFKVALHPNFPDQEVAIRGTLSTKGRTELCSLLKENLDIFAWKPLDMTEIQLAESDEEKTAFHTGQGVYCYTKMPFGIKNADATYQWLVDKTFDSQIGRNIEVYIDDLVVKSHTEAEILRDIGETFPKRLRRYFQAHPIAVITDQPIKQIMSRPGVAGRLQKWSVMLGEHNITYRPRTSVKGQKKLKLSKSQAASTPAEMKRMQNVPYASAVGSIMYAVRCTRPDVTFAQNITSRFQQNPGDIHWTTVKNILKYLMNTKDMFLVYGGDLKRELRGSCYTDAGYLTDADDLKSLTGYVFILNGGAVDWKSAKQSIFATSSAEAEYIAAFDASKEAVWVRKFIFGMGVVPTIEEPISMYCDNTGAIAIANESRITKGTRHFRAKVHYLREVIEFGDIKLEKVHTDDNLADPFTKALAFSKHSEHTRNIEMLPASNLM